MMFMYRKYDKTYTWTNNVVLIKIRILYSVLYIKILYWCTWDNDVKIRSGMIANETTFHQSSNKMNVSNYRQRYNL